MNSGIRFRTWLLIIGLVGFILYTFKQEFIESSSDTATSWIHNVNFERVSEDQMLKVRRVVFVNETNNIADIEIKDLRISSSEGGNVLLNLDLVNKGGKNDYPKIAVSTFDKENHRIRDVVFTPTDYGKSGLLSKDTISLALKVNNGEVSFKSSAFYGEAGAHHD